jgi:hypothetical protein
MSSNLQDGVIVSLKLKMDSMYGIDANPADSHTLNFDDFDLEGRVIQVLAQELEGSNKFRL